MSKVKKEEKEVKTLTAKKSKIYAGLISKLILINIILLKHLKILDIVEQDVKNAKNIIGDIMKNK